MNITKVITLFLIATSFFATAQQKQKVRTLPLEATNFLEANFKGIQIQEMYKEKEGTSFKYEVKLANGAEVDFSSRGRWREVESKTTSIPTTMFQPSVGQYIQKNYPGAKITEVKKGIRFNFIEINDKIMLQFDTQGNFNKILEE